MCIPSPAFMWEKACVSSGGKAKTVARRWPGDNRNRGFETAEVKHLKLVLLC